MKGKGKGKGKAKGSTSSSTSFCRSCGKTGHFASNCPTYRVSAVDGEDQFWNDDSGDWTYFGESEDWSDWTEWAINAVSELYNDNSWDQTWDEGILADQVHSARLQVLEFVTFGHTAQLFTPCRELGIRCPSTKSREP